MNPNQSSPCLPNPGQLIVPRRFIWRQSIPASSWISRFIPETIEGLVAAEKNLSQTRLANGATRLQPSTMMTGQAAGAIAAIAVKKNVAAPQVPVIVVQDALVKARSPISYFSYDDVDGGDPLWGDVQIASTRGVLRGYGTGVFGRDDPLTRAQSAIVLCKSLGLSTSGAPSTSPFGDVPATDPAYPFIWAVYNANLTAGCQASPLMFCPTANVTRHQLATFLAKGLDQHGRDIETGKLTWTATGGTIDKDGVFSAGPDEGNFVVTATVGKINGTAPVAIAKGGRPPPRPPLPPGKTQLTWQGEIPAQKWMNFYTKVLTRFAANKALKLTVRVELASDEPIPAQKVEETKVSLRELGLNDNVEVK